MDYWKRTGCLGTSLTSDADVKCDTLALWDSLLESSSETVSWTARTKGLAQRHKSDVLMFHLPGPNINFQPEVSVTKSSVLVTAVGVSHCEEVMNLSCWQWEQPRQAAMEISASHNVYDSKLGYGMHQRLFTWPLIPGAFVRPTPWTVTFVETENI